MFVQDFVHNGAGHGEVGSMLHQMRFDPGMLRPYFNSKNGRPSVTVNMGRTTLVKGVQTPIREHRYISDLIANGVMSPVFNATSLRKEEWIELDKVILKAARFRLRAWSDLMAANSYGGFNGMGKTVLEHEMMTDPGEALVDMDGLSEGRTDAPIFTGQGLPLPITHSDFWFSSRTLAISRNSSTPLDTVMGEAAGRRVAESIEKTTIGNNTGITFGGHNTALTYVNSSTVYGYTNLPQRLTFTTVHAPTGNGYTPSKTLADVLAMRDQLKANKFFGPYMLYTSNDWDQYMDTDYILTGGNVATQTLRNRLRQIDDIQDVRRLDFLFSALPTYANNTTGLTPPGAEGVTITGTSPFTLLMVQMTPDVCQGVNGMDITTLQWPAVGGMRLNFKVMAIQVPRLRFDAYGACGVLHATTA